MLEISLITCNRIPTIELSSLRASRNEQFIGTDFVTKENILEENDVNARQFYTHSIMDRYSFPNRHWFLVHINIPRILTLNQFETNCQFTFQLGKLTSESCISLIVALDRVANNKFTRSSIRSADNCVDNTDLNMNKPSINLSSRVDFEKCFTSQILILAVFPFNPPNLLLANMSIYKI